MTYRQMVTVLRQHEIENAEWDAALLISSFCNMTPETVISEPERDYSEAKLLDAVGRRAGHYPLQYLLGEWQFYRQTYRVTPDCLIPRADTEILVEEAIRTLPQNAFFADLCTGSGCIAVSVLCERQDATALAIDISEKALELAAENAVRNGVSERLTLKKADLITQSPAEWANGMPRPACILSNPPYIRSADLAGLSAEVLAEPRVALDGGADGMDFYRRLVTISGDWLAEGGVCLFEIGYDQGKAIQTLAADHGFSCLVKRDLSGNDRLAILKRQKPK